MTGGTSAAPAAGFHALPAACPWVETHLRWSRFCGACRGLSLPSADTACGWPVLGCFPCRGRTRGWPAWSCRPRKLCIPGRRCAPERKVLRLGVGGRFRPGKDRRCAPGRRGSSERSASRPRTETRTAGSEHNAHRTATGPCICMPSERTAPCGEAAVLHDEKHPASEALTLTATLPGAEPRRPPDRHRAGPRTVTIAGPAAGRR